MKKIIYIFLTFHLVFYFYSCNESVLETIATDRYNEANWWQTESQAVSSLNGIYAVLRSTNTYQLNNISPNSLNMSGEVALATGAHNAGNENLFRNMWNSNFRGVGRANNFLDNIDRLEIDDDQINKMKAEALFLRAFFYLNLVKYYGGVPLILESPDMNKHAKLPRNNKEEVITQILADLDNAASVLPLSYSDINVGRATKGAALALKARVLLYENRWEEAALAAKQVMDLNVYELFPDYRGLFALENENNSEVIFDVQYKVPEYTHSWDIYFELQMNSAPTLDFVNSYLMKDGLPAEESPLFDPENPFENRDPRLHKTVVVPGYLFNGNIANREKYFSTGFGFKKYTSFKDEVYRPSFSPGTSEINFIVLRYADVLLMYAEARNEFAGPEDESIYTAVNQIRSRADMPEVPKGLDKDKLREIIRKERRVEMVLEQLYYDDIRRWRIADEVMNADVLNMEGEVVQKRSFNPARDYLWPIHEVTIQENPVLEQNPGY
ncbi:MAG: RagB/SusD family nutrient uptake outer membrane protein [Bacteroidales bacterium]|nr:RagB/SusD family nutrient uptake outer membrane protein [Bacteroidales bacterium]